MPSDSPGYDRFDAARREEDRRYGLEHDDDYELEIEWAVADRLAEHASLPPGDGDARALARHLLGRGSSPYEQPHSPSPVALRAGDAVCCHSADEIRSGRVVRDLGGTLVVVDFDRHGRSVVEAAMLERKAA